MIPILYEKTETAFANNGICRLRDCLTCTVTEMRNGVYECDFSYPVTGENYEQIYCGRIVGVTHDETGDIQPFEIVSVNRPIDGIVSFHAVHISYRQNQMTVSGTNINSISDAFTLLTTAAPSNPFTYETDISSTAFMAAADGTPRNVRQMLGGVQGSILDAYGGEYEWDVFTVKLHSARGQMRDFAIRYGVNLLSYDDDTDYQSTFTSCVAYWKKDDTIVTATATLNENGYNGNDIRIPLDLSDKFEDEPTTAQLESAALSYMQSNQTNVPAQTIDVNFVRLSEMGEFSAFQDLLKCSLCDSIKVIFPMYGVEAYFKIVKTVWNVLRGSYDSMELGKLSTTLSEALGIGTNTSSSGGSGGSGAAYVTEEGTEGIWTYRKWSSGVAECWGIATASITSWAAWGSMYYGTPYTNYSYPSNLFKSGTYPVVTASGGTTSGINQGDIFGAGFGGATADTGNYQHTPKIFLTRPATGGTGSYAIFIHAIGVWK